MSDLPRRSVTAAVYGLAVLVAVAAPPIVFWGALALVAALGLMELRALRAGGGSLAFGALFFMGLASLGALRAAGALGAHPSVAADLPVWLFLAIVPTWAADVAAYLVGSAIGRRKLAPRISPGKTWEGTLAGFAACAVVALGVGAAFGLPPMPVILVALSLGPIGLAGDLLESYAKRRAGVKDSGTILPGHGGVLDRLDSLVTGAILVLAALATWSVATMGSEAGLFDRL